MRTLDTAEIANILGVSRPYVTDKLVKRADFPPPIVAVSQRLRRWRAEDVESFIRGEKRYRPRTPGNSGQSGH